MTTPTVTVSAESVLRGHALAALVDLNSIAGPVSVTVEGLGLVAELTVRPAGQMSPMGPGLTECARDVLDVLKTATRRLTRPEIIESMEAAGKVHGERTVADALATLLGRRLIVGPRVGSRDGYGIRHVG
jgi:hypothetical protein